MIAAQAGTPDGTGVFGFEHEDPRIAGSVEVALRWSDTFTGGIQSFANSVPTPSGGSHMAGFREGVAAAVNTFARERQLLTEKDTDLMVGGGPSDGLSCRQPGRDRYVAG
ncbi:hypothetical protein [Streptomyces sp. NPDC003247]|uniref:hypothetical protein n=1 Tax=Streptomyces sp. NPDC003247 TaxID=3364677 RepID=UPI00369BA925